MELPQAVDNTRRLTSKRLHCLLTWCARADVRAAFAVTLMLRLFCSLVAALPLAIVPAKYEYINSFMQQYSAQHNWPVTLVSLSGPPAYLTAPWARFDTDWYLDVALHGYGRNGTAAFMPLYPALIRVVGTLVGGHFLFAALIISTIATFGALLCLYRLAEKLSPVKDAPQWTLLVVALLPVSFFLMAGYTEAVFLWLTLAALLAFLEERWAALAVLAVLAVLTRQQGLLLSVLMLPTIGRALWGWLWEDQAGASLLRAGRALSGPVLAALVGPLAYFAWSKALAAAVHAPLPVVSVFSSTVWNQRIVWPGLSILADLDGLVHLAVPTAVGYPAVILDIAAALLTGAAIVLAARRFPLGLLFYLIAVWCAAVMKVQPVGSTIFTFGASRFLLPLLPLAVLPAEVLARSGPTLRRIWVGAGSGLGMFYLCLFVLWSWVA
jgi:hypothetical protein